jgi:hypothetical protein
MFKFSSIQTKYFWLAVILIGSAGVWLPLILSVALNQPIDWSETPLNLTTFYISIYFAGCVDGIFRTVDILENKHDIKSKLINIIALILLSIALVISTIWLSVKDYFWVPLLLSLLGAFLGLKLWWKNNTDNPTFNDEIRKEGDFIHGNTW